MRALLAFLLLMACGLLAPAHAQDGEAAERSRFVRFVEDQLSTENRRITIGEIEGALSSDVTISSITIADREGVWLTILRPHLVWRRAALLTGRLEIDSLTADAIIVTRRPVPAEGAPPPEAGFTLPDLPVSVRVGRLSVTRIEFGEPVFGEAATISLDGGIALASGVLDVDIAVRRTDGPGGSFTAIARYTQETRTLDLDLSLVEPENGIVANLLQVEEKPAISFRVEGSGPLDAFRADVSLAADAEQLLSGAVTVNNAPAGLRIVADLSGRLRELVAPAYRDFFGETSSLSFDATRAPGGAITLTRADIRSGELTLAASADLAPDLFPERIDLDARLAPADGERVTLPVPGAATTVASAALTARFGGGAGRDWSARFAFEDFRTGGLAIREVAIDASGTAENLADPAARRLTFALTGALGGLTGADPALEAAIGERLELNANGEWAAGEPVKVLSSRFAGATFSASFLGGVSGEGLSGRAELEARDLSAFAGLAGRPLAGSLAVTATGRLAPVIGAFDLDLEGTATDLALGLARVDPLLRGRTTLSGGAARSAEGLAFRGFVLENPQVSARLDGRLDSEAADLRVAARLADAAALDPRISGAVALDANVTGDPALPRAVASLTAPRLTIMGKPLEDARLGFEGTLKSAETSGAVTLSGTLDRLPLSGSATLTSLAGGGRRLSDLTLSAGDTRVTGDLSQQSDGLLEGNLVLASPDIAQIAPLLLTQATGAVEADIRLSAAEGGQSADVDARVRGLRVAAIEVGGAEIDASIENLFRQPIIDGRLEAENVRIGTTVIPRLTGTARREGQVTAFDVEAGLPRGRAAARGTLSPAGTGFRVALDALSLEQDGLAARLAAPTSVTVADGTLAFEDARLAVGGGALRITGRAGATLDLTVTAEGLPLALADAVRPDLALRGTVSGTATVAGTPSAPNVRFDVTGAGVSAAPLARAGLAPLAVRATGAYAAGRITGLDATLDDRRGVRAAVTGTVPLTGDGLDLSIDLRSLPLRLADAIRPDFGLAGTVTGTARVTGSLASPLGRFDLTGSGITAAPLARAGVPPLDIRAEGALDGRGATVRAQASGGGIAASLSGTVPFEGGGLDVTVDLLSLPLGLADAIRPDLALRGEVTGTARVTGTLAAPTGRFDLRGTDITAAPLAEAGLPPFGATASGTLEGGRVAFTAQASAGALSLHAEGSAPLGAGELAIRATGSAPLDLADRYLSARGAALSGTASFEVAVAGPLAAPRIAGTVTTEGARFVDPLSGLVLEGIRLRASLDGARVTIAELSATSAAGGAVLVTGTVGLSAGFLADLAIALEDARYEDDRLVAATLSGTLALAGPLTGAPTLSGALAVERAEVTVPERLPQGSIALDVTHIAPPPPVAATIARARADSPAGAAEDVDAGAPRGLVLDLTLDAPSRVFVRGRGLDAEFGGSVTLTGPVSAIRPVGAFSLIRGRLDVLGRRITFDRGDVTLQGDLDPYLDFLATASAGDITVFIEVTGFASDPTVSFTSQPELPQDEVLAQLLFGRGLDNLSPLQLLQLASAASELAGGASGGGVLGRLRETIGVDDIDIVTDEGGNVALQVGRYVSENVYIGVRGGAGAESTRITIDLDLTENVKARGELGADGRSSLGVYYEKEY